ncbi:MAG: tetratricopeptide repeat protein [Thermomicrobiales bacterium]
MSLSPFPSWQPSHLPHPLTPLVGRSDEVERVFGLLHSSPYRLVTLTGPGGVGKTRLALHVASSLTREFSDGVFFIPLAPIDDPSLVLPTIGQVLGIHDVAVADTHFPQRLANLLQDRRLLLVLDNFEQVIPAGPEISGLLGACPHLKALITSQSPLYVEGEQLFPLLPLPTPRGESSTEDILRTDAVNLFVQRARAVVPNLDLGPAHVATIAAICRQLDGLPLALELAAARMNILSPEALLARLSNRLQVLTGDRRDVPDRLRTMRQAIAWSYDLLTPDEQELFCQLSVFAGGIPIEAVEAIYTQSGKGEDSALDAVSRLVDHSLLRLTTGPKGDVRFLMLETLRDFGLEQVKLAGAEGRARAAHAEYYRRLAESVEPHLTGAGQHSAFDQLEAEWDNLRAALDWSLAAGTPRIALEVCARIWRFWSVRGLATEGRIWMQRTLAANEDDRSPLRVAALLAAGHLAEDQNDLDTALDHLEQSLALARAIGDDPGITRALAGIGMVYHDRSDFSRALAMHQESRRVALAIGDDRSVAVAAGNIAAVCYFRGDYDRAAHYWEECRRIVAAQGDTQGEAMTTSNLGALALDRGDFDRARDLLERSLSLQRELGDRRATAFTLTNLAEAWFRLDDLAMASQLYTEAMAIFRETGDPRSEAIVLTGMARLALAQGDCASAAAMIAESIAELARIGDATGGVEGIELLANVAVACGAHEDAATLFGATDAIRKEIDAPARGCLRSENEQVRAAAIRALGDDAFAVAHQAGTRFDFLSAAAHVAALVPYLIANAPPVTPPSPQVSATNTHGLTERELEVLRLLVDGNSTREIAEHLFISPRTASTHVTNILGKLGVTSRTAAVAYAMRTGVV